MYVGLTPYHARMVANNVDYNWNGKIDRRELDFENGSKRLVDTDRNGKVTTEELAQSLMRGDIYISSNRKAYPAYYSQPGFGQPGYQNPGYGYPPRPYYPGGYAPYPQAPAYPYNNNNGYRNVSHGENAAITAVVGAGVGAGVGYAVSGPVGVAPGAAIGGIIGLIGSLFDR
jgi:hypothetical protein